MRGHEKREERKARGGGGGGREDRTSRGGRGKPVERKGRGLGEGGGDHGKALALHRLIFASYTDRTHPPTYTYTYISRTLLWLRTKKRSLGV